MSWLQTDDIQYHAQLGLPEKGRAIKGLVVCNIWDLKPLDQLNVNYRPLKYETQRVGKDFTEFDIDRTILT